MRTALALIATAFLLLVALPLTAQATPNCSDCPDLVGPDVDIAAGLAPSEATQSPVAMASLSPRESREDLIYRRWMIITSALAGETGGNDNGPPDMGGDGGSMGGDGGGIIPEPATGLMAALGLIGLALGRRRRA